MVNNTDDALREAGRVANLLPLNSASAIPRPLRIHCFEVAFRHALNSFGARCVDFNVTARQPGDSEAVSEVSVLRSPIADLGAFTEFALQAAPELTERLHSPFGVRRFVTLAVPGLYMRP